VWWRRGIKTPGRLRRSTYRLGGSQRREKRRPRGVDDSHRVVVKGEVAKW